VPYLTPQELPEDDNCRPLSIPANTEWLALFGGALTELTKAWNWQDSGGLTVSETIEKMQEIIDNWYSEPCAACTTPGGYRAIRIGVGGVLEQLNEDGDWEAATDEYYIPPPDAREEGTEQDQICLAAANAVNVLQILYESLSDSWNNDLDDAEALTAMIEAAVLAVGFAFAPIAYGIAAFMLPIFIALYTLVEYLIADLWDADVSEQIKCFLVQCATNDAGVVTFDYDCFLGKLQANINLFDLTEEQLRLYGQIAYLLLFIGGASGLNLAGGTTAITESDCEDCAECEDYVDTLDTMLGPKTSVAQVNSGNSSLPILPATTPMGSYNSGTLGGLTGYIGQGTFEGNPGVAVLVDLGLVCNITAWSVATFSSDDSHGCGGYIIHGFLDGDFNQIIPSYGEGCWGADSDWLTAYETGISVNARYFFIAVYGSSGATVALKNITMVVNA